METLAAKTGALVPLARAGYSRFSGKLALFPVLCAAALLGGAASPVPPSLKLPVDGVAPLASSGGEFSEAAPPNKITVQTAMFAPAPMPDRDASGPSGFIDPRAGVGPRLLSTKSAFDGEGYFNGSSQNASIDARKQPAAGLGLNMPVGDAKTP